MLTIGDEAPDFSLPGIILDQIGTFSVQESRGMWLVLFFYPADFTFICPTEVMGFNNLADSFRSEDARIYGISVDSVESHREWSKELGGISYPLLSDVDRKVSQAYHVLDTKGRVSLRATFLIDPAGLIQFSTASSMNVGRSVDETLRVLRALRTGRMCPADWNPGDPTGGLEGRY